MYMAALSPHHPPGEGVWRKKLILCEGTKKKKSYGAPGSCYCTYPLSLLLSFPFFYFFLLLLFLSFSLVSFPFFYFFLFLIFCFFSSTFLKAWQGNAMLGCDVFCCVVQMMSRNTQKYLPKWPLDIF